MSLPKLNVRDENLRTDVKDKNNPNNVVENI